MTAPKEHECRKGTTINTILALVSVLVSLMCASTAFAAKAITDVNFQSATVSANVNALKKLDGNDRRIAEMQRDIAWIVMIMKEEHDERKAKEKRTP